MKKTTCILLLTINTMIVCFAQDAAFSCEKYHEYLKLMENYMVNRGKLKHFPRIYFGIPEKEWVLPLKGDTIFCDNINFPSNGGVNNPTDIVCKKDGKKIFKVEFDAAKGYNMKSFNDEYNLLEPRNQIYAPLLITEEVVAKFKLEPSFNNQMFLCELDQFNNKINCYRYFFAQGVKKYAVLIAVNAQTGEIIDILSAKANTYNYYPVYPEDWYLKKRTFYDKHLAVDCELYKKTFATLKNTNPKTDLYSAAYSMWHAAREKCGGMPNDYEREECKYQYHLKNKK